MVLLLHLLEERGAGQCIHIARADALQQLLAKLRGDEHAGALFAYALHERQRVLEVPGVEHGQLQLDEPKVP